MRGKIAAIILISVVITGVIVAIALAVEPREAHVESIEVFAEVQSDRSMLVHERVTYRFTGADSDPFTVASRDWEPKVGSTWTITDPEARLDGVLLDTVTHTSRLYEWDIAPATSGTYTYDLTYRVDNAVAVWSDTAELYWNWLGRTTSAVGEWSAEVRLPQSHDGEVLAWAHGPLDGTVRIEPDRVVSSVDDVPQGQFVDNRILMPTAWFDDLPRGQARLESILAEEARNAEDANRRRAEAERQERLRRTVRDVLTALMGPLVVGAVGGFWLVWRRWGKDPEPPADIGTYWREVPDDPPAVGAALLAWGTVNSDGYAATVMDLARRGHLRIEEEAIERKLRAPRLDYRFVRTDLDTAGLRPFERRVMQWMFRLGDTVVTQSELTKRATGDREKAYEHWTKYRKEVGQDLDSRRYIVRGNGIAFVLHAFIVIVLGAAAIAALIFGAIVAGLIGLVTAIVLTPLGILHRARTPAGTRRHAQWQGLKRFLEDFSMLDEAPVGHLALWDQYLVAATALGVAEQLVEGLHQRFPELAETTMASTPWFVSSSGRPTTSAGLGSFGKTFGSASVSSFSPPASSSGGGGGFSSGGGGGGGGGGFGAR